MEVWSFSLAECKLSQALEQLQKTHDELISQFSDVQSKYVRVHERICDEVAVLKTNVDTKSLTQKEVEEEQRNYKQNESARVMECRELTSKLDSILLRKELLEEQYQKLELLIEEEKKTFSAEFSPREQQLQQISSSIKLYADHLGLDFFQVSDKRIRFSLKFLKPTVTSGVLEPDATFDLIVFDGSYKMKRLRPALCSSEVKQCESYLKQLNKSKDLRFFVITMRNLFKTHFQSKVQETK